MKTKEGRYISLPASRLCKTETPSCFEDVNKPEVTLVKAEIADKCLALCKRSNYEEDFSLRFDRLSMEEIELTYFAKDLLPNKTAIRTEMRSVTGSTEKGNFLGNRVDNYLGPSIQNKAGQRAMRCN